MLFSYRKIRLDDAYYYRGRPKLYIYILACVYMLIIHTCIYAGYTHVYMPVIHMYICRLYTCIYATYTHVYMPVIHMYICRLYTCIYADYTMEIVVKYFMRTLSL